MATLEQLWAWSSCTPSMPLLFSFFFWGQVSFWVKFHLLLILLDKNPPGENDHYTHTSFWSVLEEYWCQFSEQLAKVFSVQRPKWVCYENFWIVMLPWTVCCNNQDKHTHTSCSNGKKGERSWWTEKKKSTNTLGCFPPNESKWRRGDAPQQAGRVGEG